MHLNKRLLKFFFVSNHIKKCSYAISLQGRRKSVRKSSIRALYRKQFIHSWEEQTVDFLIWATLIISYLALGAVNLPPIHRHFRHVGNMPSMYWWYVGLIIISVVSVSGLALSKFLHSQHFRLLVKKCRIFVQK